MIEPQNLAYKSEYDSGTRHKKSKMPLLLLGVVVVLATSVGVVTYMKFSAAPGGGFNPNMAMPAQTEAVHQERLIRTFETQGTVETENQLDLKPETEGKVVRISFVEGQQVSQGAPLVQLKADKQSAQLQQSAASVSSQRSTLQVKSSDIERLQADAQASLSRRTLAQSELARYEKLFKQEFVSELELDQKRTQAELANAEYQAALKRVASARSEMKQASSELSAAAYGYKYNRAMASDTVIVAPFSGVVGQKYIALGDYVTQGQKLLTLVDNHNLKINFKVPERYFGFIKLDAPVGLTVESLPGEVFHAQTIFMDPAVDMSTRSVTVKARVQDGIGHLKPGQFAQVKLTLSENPHALTIRESSLVPQGEKFFVYVVRNGAAVLQEIKTGQREAGRVEVTEGLLPTDRVVISGLQKLTDGQKITEIPQEKAPEKAQGSVPAKQAPADPAQVKVPK